MAVTGVLDKRAKLTGKTKEHVFDEIVAQGKTQFRMAVLLGCQPGNIAYWLREFHYRWDSATRSWVKEKVESGQPQNAA